MPVLRGFLGTLAHLSSFNQIPEYVCVKAHIPENTIADVRDFGPLPADWASPEPLQARALGRRWLSERASAVLRVPSVIIPREPNYVLMGQSGEFVGAFKHVRSHDQAALRIELLSEEAVKASEIEGEILNRDSVQSSLRHAFGLGPDHPTSLPPSAVLRR